jgi:hypothetical protein
MNAPAHQEFFRPDITIERFEATDIDADRFDHEAHVYVAWLYVSEYELPEAIARFDGGLKRLVIKIGAAGKYHATLTWFFLLLIAERAEEGEPWQAFRQQNADLITASKETLSRYYSDDYLFSERARERFVLPDKLENALKTA